MKQSNTDCRACTPLPRKVDKMLEETQATVGEMYFRTVQEGKRPPEAISLRELAELVGVSTRYARFMDQQRWIPGRFKIGRLTRFKFRTVKHWINAGMPRDYSDDEAETAEFLLDRLFDDPDTL